MTIHSVAEARDRLLELIDRATAGEGVLITREGHPAVELRVVPGPRAQTMDADLDWLAARRRHRGRPSIEAGGYLEMMRDGDWR